MVRIVNTVGIAMTTAVAVLAVFRCHWLAIRTDRGPYDGNFSPIAPDISRQGYIWEASGIMVSWDSYRKQCTKRSPLPYLTAGFALNSAHVRW